MAIKTTSTSLNSNQLDSLDKKLENPYFPSKGENDFIHFLKQKRFFLPEEVLTKLNYQDCQLEMMKGGFTRGKYIAETQYKGQRTLFSVSKHKGQKVNRLQRSQELVDRS